MNRRLRCKCLRTGFTLVEVMVVTVIVAILGSLAYPSYQQAVRKAKRAEGRAALLQLMQQQERYYTLHTRYIAFSAVSNDDDARRFKWYSGDSSSASAYEISASACADETLQECVVLTAQAGSPKVNAAHADPQCGLLSLSSTGVKSPPGADCW